MKLNWTGIGAVIASLAVVLGWAWSIEHRLGQATDVSGRLRSIEEALFPVLIDYKVSQIIHEREHPHTYGSLEAPGGDGVFEDIRAPLPAPDPEPPRPLMGTGGPGFSDLEPAPMPESEPVPAEVQHEAETWAREQLSLD